MLLKEKPWFVPEAVEFLEQLIQPDWAILETGGGGSTIWFAERAKRVVAFEQYKVWYERIVAGLEEKGLKNVDLRLDGDYPTSGITGFGDEEFDFISIDGRGRVKSIMTAKNFLKHGGYLLLDNSERDRYSRVFEKLKDWEKRDFIFNKDWMTTIWRKP